MGHSVQGCPLLIMNTLIFLLIIFLAPVILFYLALIIGALLFAIQKEIDRKNGKI